MTMTRRRLPAALLALAALVAVPALAPDLFAPDLFAQEQKPLAEPLLVTSSGQALDAFTVKTLLGRAGVTNDYDALAQVAKLDGKKTVIIAMGASIKGFGAAGITAETEIARTRALLEAAKAKGITIVGIHIGGADRRGGASEQFVQLVAPASDHLVVSKDGDKDSYFTNLAKEKNIPLTLIDQPLQVGATLARQLGKSS